MNSKRFVSLASALLLLPLSAGCLPTGSGDGTGSGPLFPSQGGEGNEGQNNGDGSGGTNGPDDGSGATVNSSGGDGNNATVGSSNGGASSNNSPGVSSNNDAGTNNASGSSSPARRIEGNYLLALHAPSVAGSFPFLFLTSVTLIDDWTVELGFAPLASDNVGEFYPGMEPRTLVGGTANSDYIALDSDGRGSFDLYDIQLPGEANPDSGFPVAGDMYVELRTGADGTICGTATGWIYEPIESEISSATFGSVEVMLEEGFGSLLGYQVITSCP